MSKDTKVMCTQLDDYFGKLDIPTDWVHDIRCLPTRSIWRSPTNSVVMTLSLLESKAFKNATLAQLFELSRDLYDHVVDSEVVYDAEDLFGGHVVHTVAFSEETNMLMHAYVYASRKSVILIEIKIFDEKEIDTAKSVIDSLRPMYWPRTFKECELRKRVSQFCEEEYFGRVMLLLPENAVKYDDKTLKSLIDGVVKSMKQSDIEYMPYATKEVQCEKIFNEYFAEFPKESQDWAHSKLKQHIESGPIIYEQNLKFLYEITCKAESYRNRKEYHE